MLTYLRNNPFTWKELLQARESESFQNILNSIKKFCNRAFTGILRIMYFPTVTINKNQRHFCLSNNSLWQWDIRNQSCYIIVHNITHHMSIAFKILHLTENFEKNFNPSTFIYPFIPLYTFLEFHYLNWTIYTAPYSSKDLQSWYWTCPTTTVKIASCSYISYIEHYILLKLN